ncbi:sigma-70 family RNA polymerase sigma factor [Patescibacteria group bacterium]|nr:sigma-70 family RNA polymerase sigma factor [Patescibacteria group bacterium]MBU1868313.1 sigma-70 family RNA polymerase sigma factor [Patescibacteria group bacterium]
MPKIKELRDEELVEYVRSKDQEQYREVVARYQEKLLRYAERIVNDRDAAQDTVQQAFIKAFANLKGFDVSRKFSSWIYRIVHNEAINLLKRGSKEVTVNPELWQMVSDDSDEGFEKALEDKERDKLLNDCLKEIPVIYRAPVSLFFFDSKSYEEISDILRMPMGTVGTRMKRGKKLLKQVYLAKARQNPFGG